MEKATGSRVLGRVRLSRSTEESTSVERQRELIKQWADAAGHTVVGWAEDIDVSGSVDPFDTPQLGEWLNNRAPEWDVLCAWKLDRLGRNAIQLNKLFGWCQDHAKTVVSTSESIDLGSWAGRMLAGVIAGLAEGELEAIRERQRSSRAKLRQSARWPGGKPPFGYVAVPRTDGPGKQLVIDTEAAAIVRRIVDGVIGGSSLGRIADELNAEGIPTPADWYRRLRGQPGPFTGQWYTTPIRNLLRSPALRGYSHHNGATVRDDDGAPIQLAEPLVDQDEWELVQAALDRIRDAKAFTRNTDVSPLSGLTFCARCGSPAYHTRGQVKRGEKRYDYRYYLCDKRCSPRMPAEVLERHTETAFLDQLAHREVRERVWVPGDSREADLRRELEALDELTSMVGQLTSTVAKQRLQQQIAAVDARIAELESAPAQGARWEYRGTGQTYGQVWELSDVDARRELLTRQGITIKALRDGNAWQVEVFSPRETMGAERDLERERADEQRAEGERRKWGILD